MPSSKCLEVLSQLTNGLLPDTCVSRKARGKLVMCRARQLVEQGQNYSQSMKQAWKEVKGHCAKEK